ncbi:MAG: histidine phosphatase family protein [Isosphaeraceae bacterium]
MNWLKPSQKTEKPPFRLTTRIYLVEPGATCFDEQERIAGNLDLPLSEKGLEQVKNLRHEISDISVTALYHSPCLSAELTALAIEPILKIRAKCSSDLRNLDFGIWQGMCWEEMEERFPRVWRQWLENPEEITIPRGESIEDLMARAKAFIDDVLRRYENQSICVIAPFPLSAVLSGLLKGFEKPRLTKMSEGGTIEAIDMDHES